LTPDQQKNSGKVKEKYIVTFMSAPCQKDKQYKINLSKNKKSFRPIFS